jgi:D-tyrosyl-tRNA(Tyr) deacylase
MWRLQNIWAVTEDRPYRKFMRVVIQRVSSARVIIDSAEHSRISAGILVLLGVEKEDTAEDALMLARRIVELRIFEDEAGKMNRSIVETGGHILVVSQFTLLGDCRKGRRPSFDAAAPPNIARALYETFVQEIRGLGIPVSTGVFQAMMDVQLTNQGPVTLILDSRKRF